MLEAKLFLEERRAYWEARGLAPGPAYSYALEELGRRLDLVNPKIYPIDDEL